MFAHQESNTPKSHIENVQLSLSVKDQYEDKMEYAAVNFVPTIHHDTYDRINPSKTDLSGRNVLITGASRGLGKAMAVSYAKAGVSGIALLARSDLSAVESEIHEVAQKAGHSSPKILRVKADATDRASVEKAAEEIASAFDSIDILVNNAGYLETFKPWADTDPDEWWKVFEVNVKGVYLTTRSFLPLVLKSKEKTLVMVSSIGGVATRAGASGYQTTKTVVLRLNDFLMAEYGQQGLLAYGIHPGGVMTELAKVMPKELHGNLQDTPELAGDTLVFLTAERREWLADRYISVNWDVDELVSKKDEIVKNDLLKVRLRF
ncbi:hypothetical protein LTR10_024354 [Elasticomyces elasticus]|uniref:NAD-P-binding protein n=1 Tax=Exophiala sideris TaxID=1016849 RepID=A0ABR0JNG1_9EURO|nr:hypothetical protein LTR10_024354 [Elasticomyces elasticus]KAK5036458.1 hypothetical protein LTS07_002185 [Exophiala sideris]KAK5041713.1 hypothetical protein LTR13_002380 [Exophiala sideris]KAK5066841.1 hypothetical protein LTR69_002189 [Exophiala sideris]KAK5184900.1 hypothetical protein LTR44_002746 [Eurotiomycetes sp. CCFEE 6388]